jgi:glutamate--cysteine ligase
LKTYLEVRAADSQAPDLMLGTPAFMKGILYDSDCLDAAWDVVSAWTMDERLQAGEDAARDAMDARVRRHRLRDYALELVQIARTGLARDARLNSAGRDESVYLEPLEQDVRAGECPADRILRRWSGEWRGDVMHLISATAYRP